ncbi:MAG: hypothetical protein ACO1NX_08850 [Chitinophagaceae bacterium]
MAINKNHEAEELAGVKCAIVEKGVSQQRADFLKDLLEWNKYTVMVVPSAPPKAAPVSAPTAEGEAPVIAPEPLASFTVGVTDVTFNPINAVFGRLLKTRDNHIVTLAYWQQKEAVVHDDIPYYEKR